MKKINIYLTENEYITIKKKCQKYMVSMSTICDKVVSNFLKAINNTEIDNEIWKKMKKKEHLFSIKGNKRTSIKPKIYDWWQTLPRPMASDCLKMYANNSWKTIFKNQPSIDKMLSGIDKELTQTYDQFYNYNDTLRNSIRVFKENREYIEKLRKDKAKDNEH